MRVSVCVSVREHVCACVCERARESDLCVTSRTDYAEVELKEMLAQKIVWFGRSLRSNNEVLIQEQSQRFKSNLTHL